MPDASIDRAVKDEAQQLTDSISRRWPKRTMVPVEDDMRYGQYAEAVLNIIAISYKENLDLRTQEISHIQNLIGMMKLKREVSEMIDFLKRQDRHAADEGERVMAFLA